MKTFATLVSLMLVGSALSQLTTIFNAHQTTGSGFYLYRIEYDGTVENKKNVEIFKENNVKSVQVEGYKKDKKLYTRTHNRNSDGKIIQSISKMGDFTINYDNTGNVEHIIKTKKGNVIEDRKLDFTPDNNLIGYELTKKGKSKRRIEKVYHGQFLFTKTTFLKGKLRDSSIYKRNNNHDLLQSEFYKKGKLYKKYTYDCDKKGTDITKKEIASCHFYENRSDGSYISFFRRTVDGKVELFENRYDKDSNLVEAINYIDEKLSQTRLIKGNNLITTFYKKDGETVNKEIISTYDKNENEVRRITKVKGEIKSDYQLKYNEKGLLIESFNALNSKYRTKYSYTYF